VQHACSERSARNDDRSGRTASDPCTGSEQSQINPQPALALSSAGLGHEGDAAPTTHFDFFVFVLLSLAELYVALIQAILGLANDDSARSGARQRAIRSGSVTATNQPQWVVMEIPRDAPETMKYSEKQQLSYVSDRWGGCAYLQHLPEKRLRSSFTSQV
jgi:hypothetical protein